MLCVCPSLGMDLVFLRKESRLQIRVFLICILCRRCDDNPFIPVMIKGGDFRTGCVIAARAGIVGLPAFLRAGCRFRAVVYDVVA